MKIPFSVTRFARRAIFNECFTYRLVPAQFSQSIGKHTYGAPILHFWNDETKLKIGDYCSIADGVSFILGGNHRVDWVSTYPFTTFVSEAKDIPGHPATKGDIIIGNDVWIGYGAKVFSGVTIGDGAVIGACSVVVKDVPAYGIVVGAPAKLVKYRFPAKQRKELSTLAWWSWSEEKITRNVKSICSPNIEIFLDKHKKKRS